MVRVAAFRVVALMPKYPILWYLTNESPVSSTVRELAFLADRNYSVTLIADLSVPIPAPIYLRCVF